MITPVRTAFAGMPISKMVRRNSKLFSTPAMSEKIERAWLSDTGFELTFGTTRIV